MLTECQPWMQKHTIGRSTLLNMQHADMEDLHVFQGGKGGGDSPAAGNGPREAVVMQCQGDQALKAVCGAPTRWQRAVELIAMHIQTLKRLHAQKHRS